MPTAREAAIRPTWSPWLTIAVALAWLVALAIAVDGVSLALQLWLVSVVAAALVRRRLGRQPRSGKAGPTAEDAEAPGRDNESADEGGSEPGEEDDAKPAPQQVGDAELRPSPAPQPATVPAPQARAPLEVWTASDVALVLQVPEQVVIEEMSSGNMPGNTVGGEWRVRAAALVQWLDGAYGERRVRS